MIRAVTLAMIFLTSAHDGGPQSASGGNHTGVIAGKVLTADPSNMPVSGAIVTLRSRVLQRPLVAISSQDGAFRFEKLEPGRYTIAASRDPYLQTAYGALRPGGPGVEVFVAGGKAVEDVTIGIANGAVLSGVVRLQSGEVVPDMEVEVYRKTVLANSPRFVQLPGRYLTNDRGEYRVFGLYPGTYIVSATSANEAGSASAMSAAEVDAALQRLKSRRGVDGKLAVLPERQVENVEEISTGKFVRTYYPSGLEPSDASAVLVDLGLERAGIDVTVRFATTSRLTGVLTGNIDTASARVELTYVGPTIVGRNASPRTALATLAMRDGTFAFADLPAGQYNLRAVSASRSSDGAGQGRQAGSSEIYVPEGSELQVSIPMVPARQLSGKLVLRRMLSQAEPALDSFVVSLRMIDSQDSAAIERPVRPDGSFSVDGLFPGDYSVDVIGPHNDEVGWILDDVVIEGRRSGAATISLRDQAKTTLTLNMTDAVSAIKGRLLGPAPLDEPISGYSIVAISVLDEVRRSPRGIRITKTGQDGRFNLNGLMPGEYFLCAFVEVTESDLSDAALLSRLASMSIKIALTPGVILDQDMRVRPK